MAWMTSVLGEINEGEEAEEDWKLVKPSEFGAGKTKAGCWCLEKSGRTTVGAAELGELSDMEEESDDDDESDNDSDGSLGSGGD